MPDKKEIVLQRCKNAIDYGEPIVDYSFYYEVIALLKKQEEMPFRCKTCAKHTENGICRRWMQEVKDDDYCSFGERM